MRSCVISSLSLFLLLSALSSLSSFSPLLSILLTSVFCLLLSLALFSLLASLSGLDQSRSHSFAHTLLQSDSLPPSLLGPLSLLFLTSSNATFLFRNAFREDRSTLEFPSSRTSPYCFRRSGSAAWYHTLQTLSEKIRSGN